MHLEEVSLGSLVGISRLDELMNPMSPFIVGRRQAEEEEQDEERFQKEGLVFPSGKPLPRCRKNRFCLDFSGKGEVRFRSFDLGTGRWIFAGIRSCVQ